MSDLGQMGGREGGKEEGRRRREREEKEREGEGKEKGERRRKEEIVFKERGNTESYTLSRQDALPICGLITNQNKTPRLSHVC